MTRMWKAWLEFWSHTETGFSIAMVRISIGLTLFYTCASPYFSGVWQAIWVDQQFGGIRSYRTTPWFLEWLGGATPEAVELLIWIGLASSCALTIGVFGRYAAFMGMLVMNTISWHNPLATGGHDDLIANALWLLIFVPNDITVSVSSKVKTGSWTSTTPISSAVRRLLLAQLIVMYTSTGWQKVSTHWVPFGELDALWYILQQPTWAWRDHSFLASWYPLTQIGTFGTWLFEVCAPLCWIGMLWEGTKTKTWYAPAWGLSLIHRLPPRIVFAAVGIPMHLAILLTMDVGPFSYAALSYYWTLYRSEK
jgi:hypothetical protein